MRSGTHCSLISCIPDTFRVSQRIIAIFPQSKYFRGEKGLTAKEITQKLKKIVSCLFVFFASRILPLVLKLQNAQATRTATV